MRQHIRALTFAFSIAAGCTALPAAVAAQALPGAPALTAQPHETRPVSEPPSSDRSVFADLVGDLGNDFRRLPSLDAVAILSIGGAGAAIAGPWDRPASLRLSGASELRPVFSAGATIGGTYVQMAGALTTYTVGRVTDNVAVRAIGADLFRAQVMTQGLTHGLKLATGRSRPDGTQYSFPSGHSSTAFATATVLQRHLGWKVGIPAHALAAYVAASRVQTRRHFVSDVAFGAAIGIVAGRTITVGRGATRFAVTPAVGSNSASVSFTLVSHH